GSETLNEVAFGAVIIALSIIGTDGATAGISDSADQLAIGFVKAAAKKGVIKGTLPAVLEITSARTNTLIGTAVLTGATVGGDAAPETDPFISVGNSPALIVEQGTVTWSNSWTSTATDAPTIIVTGGTLTLENNLIAGNLGGSQPLIEVEGGTLILGAHD